MFFRAATLGDAVRYLGAMFGFASSTSASPLTGAIVYGEFHLAVLVVAATIVWFGRPTEELVQTQYEAKAPVAMAFTGGVVVVFVLGVFEMSVQSFNPFLYFQF